MKAKPLHHIKFLSSFLSILVFLITWETISDLELVNVLLFPPPSQVFMGFLEWLRDSFWADLLVSYYRMAFGFVWGSIIGIMLGLLTGRQRWADWIFSPILQLLRSLPPVAIIPLIIVWFGISEPAKIFSVAFAVMMPVWVNTHLGAQQVPQFYLDNAKVLNASSWKVFSLVILPASFPSIIAGLRVAIAMAFIMIYVAEIAGASQGIGYQISVSHLAYRIDKMMASLIILGSIAALTDWLFYRGVLWLFPWLKLGS